MSMTPTQHCVSLDSAVASFSPDRSFFLSFHHSRTAEFNERILTHRFQNIIVAEAKYFDNDGVHLSSAIDVVNHNENNVPPHFLRFAVGARMIVLRNLMPSQGLANGILVEVVSFAGGIVYATLLSYLVSISLYLELESKLAAFSFLSSWRSLSWLIEVSPKRFLTFS